MMIGGREFVDYPTAAALCGCGRSRLQAAVAAGQIASARPGRRKLLRLDDVHAWLESQIQGRTRRPGRPRRI